MNRILCATIVLGGFLWTLSPCHAVSPSIRGVVSRFDVMLSEVELELYVDSNGDAEFNEPDFFTGATTTTDGDGAYIFDQLAADQGFFVVQPSQTVDGMTIPRMVSAVQRPSRNQLIVDSFDITQDVQANPLSKFRSNSVTGPGNLILGGERDAYVQVMGGSADAKLRVNPYSMGSSLQFDVAAGVTGMGVITWDGMDDSAAMTPSDGLGGIDLTGGGTNEGFAIRMAIDRAGDGQMAKLMLFTDGEMSSVDVAFPVTPDVEPNTTILVPFDEFEGDAVPTRVDAIQLMIDAYMPSIDARISEIGIVGPSETVANFAVPEPSTMVVCLLAIPAAWLWRRRAR